jgi:hypothetical protein
MTDSTGSPWPRGFKQRPKPTLSALRVIARRTISCPRSPGNARRRVTDAEMATLCVAQAIMGIPSDRRFLAVARKRLADLFPELPQQPGFHKRRARPAETIEWLIGSPRASMTTYC